MLRINKNLLDLFQSHGAHTASLFSFESSAESSILKKDLPAFELWLLQHGHAEMSFLEKNFEARKNPNHILPQVKSAIIFLFPYATGQKIRASKLGLSDTPNFSSNLNPDSLIGKNLISRYAQGKDYHKVLKKNLTNIAQNLQNYLGEEFTFRPVIDAIPFFERAYAREAQLGFIGKNTMLIRPGMGSFFFIATLLTNLPWQKIAYKTELTSPIANLDCGTCTKCIEACPTNALLTKQSNGNAPYLDANKCLSYLSIEHRNTVPDEYLPHFEKTIYGCDICQEVCPYNLVTTEFAILKEFSQKHPPFLSVTLKEVALMSPSKYEQWFGGTATTRAKYQGLVRNALYHLYAVSDKELREILIQLKNSEFELITKTVQQLTKLLTIKKY